MFDTKLEHIRRRAYSRVVSRGLNTGETKIVKRKELLYRQFTQGNKSSLLVPSSFREKVLKLAHESLMAGRLGIRQTCLRVFDDFFWPGICSDLTRFCKSCKNCQKVFHKGS